VVSIFTKECIAISYGCKIWLVTLREKYMLRVLENKVLRRIVQPKRNEVTGKWGRLSDKEFYVLYSSPNIIWVVK
jgi:hypothetical protein